MLSDTETYDLAYLVWVVLGNTVETLFFCHYFCWGWWMAIFCLPLAWSWISYLQSWSHLLWRLLETWVLKFHWRNHLILEFGHLQRRPLDFKNLDLMCTLSSEFGDNHSPLCHYVDPRRHFSFFFVPCSSPHRVGKRLHTRQQLVMYLVALFCSFLIVFPGFVVPCQK